MDEIGGGSMIPTVGDVMREVRNYFPKYQLEKTWMLNGGTLSPDDWLLEGDWIAISGSRRNNGVYQVQADKRLPGCVDDRFDGEIWLLAPPVAFLSLCEEIAAWCQVQPTDGLKRESFGGYSRELALDANGRPLTWQKRFDRELQPYRRMYAGVKFRC